MRFVALLITLSYAFAAPALAQSTANPSGTSSPADIQFTAHDIATLLKATKDADTSPNIDIKVLGKDPSEMPAYDPIVHFAGVDGTSGVVTIWIVKSAPKTPSSAKAFLAAMELACMATGFAGPQWKAIYDQLAALDAALPPNDPNPYKYRLALTARIQTIVDSYAPK